MIELFFRSIDNHRPTYWLIYFLKIRWWHKVGDEKMANVLELVLSSLNRLQNKTHTLIIIRNTSINN